MSKGTLLMDAYLAGLEPHRQLLIQQVFTPFAFTAMSIERLRVKKSLLLKREVMLYVGGFPTRLGISGRTEKELDEREAVVRGLSEETLSRLAPRDLEQDFLAEDTCALPTILNVCDFHERYPVFGILMGGHNLRCESCTNGYTEGEQEVLAMIDSEEVPLDAIIDLSEADEQVLIDLAGRFLARLDRQLLPSEYLSLATENPIALAEALDDLDWLPALAKAFDKASFLWMASHPYFFNDIFHYGWMGEELQLAFWQFEADLVAKLPFDIRQEYKESASMLRGHFTAEFFASIG